MQFIAPWLWAVVALIAGYLAGQRASLGPVAPALAAATIVLVAAGSVAAWRRSFGQGRFALLLAFVAASSLRGYAAAEGERLDGLWRGPASRPGWKTLEVRGASTPGPRCQVLGQDEGGFVVELRVPGPACPLAEGQRVRVAGQGDRPLPVPGSLGPRDLARSVGAHDIWYRDHLYAAGGAATVYWGAVARLRERAFAATRGDPSRGFLAASLLGLRRALPPDERAALRVAGLGHLIAVSGMHVGLAALMVQALAIRSCLRLRAPLWLAIALTWIPILGYVGLTGAAPSAIRAAAMHGLVGLGTLLGRPPHGLHMLALTGTIMLFWRPRWALDPGFQLSMVAMAAVLRTPAGWGVLGQSWRVGWAVTPLSILHFGQATPYGFIVNVVAVPLFTLWVAPAGALGWLAFPWLGTAGLEPAAAGASALLGLARRAHALPELSWWTIGGAAAAMVLARWLPVGPRSRWHRWVHPCLPTAASGTATAVAAAGMLVPSEATPPPWFAFGAPRAPTLVVIDPASSQACIETATGAYVPWPEVLHAFGVSAVVALQAPRAGPHLEAVRIALGDRWRPDAAPRSARAGSPCGPRPGAEAVERALEHCAARAAGRRGWVVGPLERGRCYLEGGFVPLEVRPTFATTGRTIDEEDDSDP